MALSKNNQIDWADIENIYTKLNTQRTRFGFTQKTVPSNQDVKSTPNDVISLKDSIEEMKSHYRLSSVASTDSVETPSSGDLMVTNPFDTINNIAAINPEEQSVEVVPQDDYVCLWGIGIGGSGEAFGSVRDVKFYEREIGQNGYTTQMIPFRVTPAAIDGVDSKYYLRKKMIYPNTSSTDAFYSYYAKEFEVEPFIRTLLRDGAEGEDGSEVTDGVHDRQPTYEIETFVEMHLKLEKSDAREYFEYNGNIEQARINTIGLFTGRKVAIDILDSTGLKVGTRYDYKDVKLFSKFNFDNEALVNKKEINFTYRIYVS